MAVEETGWKEKGAQQEWKGLNIIKTIIIYIRKPSANAYQI